MSDACRIYEDDEGNPIRVRGEEPLNEDDQAALKEIVAAVRRRYAMETDTTGGTR